MKLLLLPRAQVTLHAPIQPAVSTRRRTGKLLSETITAPVASVEAGRLKDNDTEPGSGDADAALLVDIAGLLEADVAAKLEADATGPLEPAAVSVVGVEEDGAALVAAAAEDAATELDGAIEPTGVATADGDAESAASGKLGNDVTAEGGVNEAAGIVDERITEEEASTSVEEATFAVLVKLVDTEPPEALPNGGENDATLVPEIEGESDCIALLVALSDTDAVTSADNDGVQVVLLAEVGELVSVLEAVANALTLIAVDSDAVADPLALAEAVDEPDAREVEEIVTDAEFVAEATADQVTVADMVPDWLEVALELEAPDCEALAVTVLVLLDVKLVVTLPDALEVEEVVRVQLPVTVTLLDAVKDAVVVTVRDLEGDAGSDIDDERDAEPLDVTDTVREALRDGDAVTDAVPERDGETDPVAVTDALGAALGSEMSVKYVAPT